MTAQDHNKSLGILFLIFGTVNILLLIPITLQIIRALKNIESAASTNPNPDAVNNAIGLIMILLVVVGVFSLISSVIELSAGFGMIKRRSWARAAATLAAIISLINFPFGIALGIYGLWFLFGNKGKEFYGDRISLVRQISPNSKK